MYCNIVMIVISVIMPKAADVLNDQTYFSFTGNYIFIQCKSAK